MGWSQGAPYRGVITSAWGHWKVFYRDLTWAEGMLRHPPTTLDLESCDHEIMELEVLRSLHVKNSFYSFHHSGPSDFCLSSSHIFLRSYSIVRKLLVRNNISRKLSGSLPPLSFPVGSVIAVHPTDRFNQTPERGPGEEPTISPTVEVNG